ncbi:L-asparaginase II [Rhizomicrobium palustre]|uniref:L-asparaginase II n=1 Tax=Rhizomicrobium palustre TaxID=189966 RepID=A0A846N3V4_9PROT|nr:asparaginase [Rhizomicrobium palustre]NIK90416.1 L-asparaginase II [Rhizomicrobium palustre]
MTNPILVEVTRNLTVESLHRGAVAVVDGDGKTLFALGDVTSPAYTRSSLKPIQALPLVESGAADAFGLSEAELALACASHSGEMMHTAPVQAWLTRLGLSESDLACGPQTPRYEPAAVALAAAGERPCRLHNNCSGKHAGFLTLAKHLGVPTQGYQRLDHPVQQAVLAAVERLSGETNLAWGIDGCAAPNFALPLTAFARALAQLAAGKTAGGMRLVKAMMAHPELVGGTGRFCTRAMQAMEGRAAVKVGAEGVYAAMLPGTGLGVAIKIDDGAVRGAEVAVAVVLEKLGVLAAEKGLATHPILNTAGESVGEVRPSQELRAITIG